MCLGAAAELRSGGQVLWPWEEDWLEKYNDGQNRLPAEKLELMMWKLEAGEATQNL